MNFHYDIKVSPFDFFIMSLSKTYKSFIGIVNIVFSVSMILLTVKFYSVSSPLLQLIMIILCIIFPVFQPLSMYYRSKALVSKIAPNLSLDIDDTGILVSVNEQSEKIRWKRVKNIIDTKRMLIIKVDENNGYFLTNKVLSDTRDAFKEFVLLHIGK